jgi:MOSC domain-containing protein YiiM
MTGTLIGIARKPARRAPMEMLTSAKIWLEEGLEGDHSSRKYPKRQITILSKEDWETAIAAAGVSRFAWTARRANLLVEGVVLPRSRGSILRVGPVMVEITNQTIPCSRMDEAFPGLRKALHPEWRGGVTCKVIEGGDIHIGDLVEVVVALPERKVYLPG